MPELMNRIVIILSSLLICFMCGCEKSISFTPDNASPLLVVDASIQNGSQPYVTLSRSLNYFSKISSEELLNSFIHDAVITISNGSKTHTLREYKKDLGGGFSSYIYTTDTADLATSFNGEEGKTYIMNILAEGKEYTATTTIPMLSKTLDSLWSKPAPDNPDTNKVVLMTRSTDPPGFGNYIRYFTKTNDDPFFPGLNSVADDQVIDGKTYEIQVDRGVDRNSEIDFEEYAFFLKGDRVTVKLCNIDKATFDFFRTLEFSYSSIGNPFSSPTKVLGNISGGALGYFGGYAAQLISIQIPR
jgi:hypothetical protein